MRYNLFKIFQEMNMEPENSGDTADRVAARKIVLHEMRAKWEKLSEHEAAAIRGRADLIRQLQAHYGLEPKYAQWEVENFLKGRAF
jgi:hypothetical protein